MLIYKTSKIHPPLICNEKIKTYLRFMNKTTAPSACYSNTLLAHFPTTKSCIYFFLTKLSAVDKVILSFRFYFRAFLFVCSFNHLCCFLLLVLFESVSKFMSFQLVILFSFLLCLCLLIFT